MATGRRPTARELALLLDVLAAQRSHFADRPDDARSLVEVGESSPPADLDPVELAAWTQLATLLLNLDETVTRG